MDEIKDQLQDEIKVRLQKNIGFYIALAEYADKRKEKNYGAIGFWCTVASWARDKASISITKLMNIDP